MTSNELTGLGCLEASEILYLYRSVDTCPLFSFEPTRSNVWELHVYDKFAQQRAEESKQYDHKLKARSCEWPTLIDERIILEAGTKFYLEGAHTISDTIGFNRLFLNVILNSSEGSIKWSGEIGMNQEPDIRKRILSRFKVCNSGS